MPRFEFKYETLLRHRRNVEDQRQRELAQLMRSRMILVDQLHQAQQTVRQSRAQLSESLVGRVDLSRIAQFAGYSQQETSRGRQIVQRLAEYERRIADARQTLADAMRQRKALELLRDRQHEQWQREQQRRESAELDELATQRYVAGMAEEARA